VLIIPHEMEPDGRKHPQQKCDDGHMSLTTGQRYSDNPERRRQMSPVTPQALTRTVQDFLSEAAGAVVLENGAVAFDLAQSKILDLGRVQPLPA
jgi:hypothetical protein